MRTCGSVIVHLWESNPNYISYISRAHINPVCLAGNFMAMKAVKSWRGATLAANFHVGLHLHAQVYCSGSESQPNDFSYLRSLGQHYGEENWALPLVRLNINAALAPSALHKIPSEILSDLGPLPAGRESRTLAQLVVCISG